jgi:hypothetical protein
VTTVICHGDLFMPLTTITKEVLSHMDALLVTVPPPGISHIHSSSQPPIAETSRMCGTVRLVAPSLVRR